MDNVLKIKGIDFDQLYLPSGAMALDQLFLAHVAEVSVDLAAQLQHHRLYETPLSGELLLALSEVLESFYWMPLI